MKLNPPFRAISDGEQRRTFFHVDFLEKIGGVKAELAKYEIKFRGGHKDVTLVPPILAVVDKLQRTQGIATDDFRFLQSVVPAGLYALGCRYVQLDDTNLAYLCDPAHRERVKAQGEDPNALPALYAKLISDSVKLCPADMAIGIHLCRGNHRSAWAAEGGYEPVADIMFNECGVDTFFLWW